MQINTDRSYICSCLSQLQTVISATVVVIIIIIIITVITVTATTTTPNLRNSWHWWWQWRHDNDDDYDDDSDDEDEDDNNNNNNGVVIVIIIIIIIHPFPWVWEHIQCMDRNKIREMHFLLCCNTKKSYCTRCEGLWEMKQKESDEMSPGQYAVNPPSILESTIPDHQFTEFLQLFWISSIW